MRFFKLALLAVVGRFAGSDSRGHGKNQPDTVRPGGFGRSNGAESLARSHGEQRRNRIREPTSCETLGTKAFPSSGSPPTERSGAFLQGGRGVFRKIPSQCRPNQPPSSNIHASPPRRGAAVRPLNLSSPHWRTKDPRPRFFIFGPVPSAAPRRHSPWPRTSFYPSSSASVSARPLRQASVKPESRIPSGRLFGIGCGNCSNHLRWNAEPTLWRPQRMAGGSAFGPIRTPPFPFDGRRI